MAKIITIAAIKGGTGKTTVAGTLAQAAAKDGKRVLAIDLDAQGSLTFFFNGDFSLPGSYDLLMESERIKKKNGEVDPSAAIQHTPGGIDLIPGHANLAALKTSPGSARRLEKALKPIRRNYDLIVIDTAPAMGEGQHNALFASTDLLIPLYTDTPSLQGFYYIANIARDVRKTKPSLKTAGVFLAQYDGRSNFSKFIRETLQEKAAEMKVPYLGEIRKSTVVPESMFFGKSIFDYAPKSKPAADYMDLYKKVMEG